MGTKVRIEVDLDELHTAIAGSVRSWLSGAQIILCEPERTPDGSILEGTPLDASETERRIREAGRNVAGALMFYAVEDREPVASPPELVAAAREVAAESPRMVPELAGAKITANTITDDQIRAMRDDAWIGYALGCEALGFDPHGLRVTHEAQRAARARCAMILTISRPTP